MKIRYSLTRFPIYVQDERTAMGIRKVVSRTSQRLMPSTPRWYWMP